MPRYEYKVVPAPSKGKKAKGVRGVEARFSHALEDLMNTLAADGWEYQRSETLPSIERTGLASSTTEWRNVMVFRRAAASDISSFEPELLPAPAPVAMTAPVLAAVTAQQNADEADDAPETTAEPTEPETATAPQPSGATQDQPPVSDLPEQDAEEAALAEPQHSDVETSQTEEGELDPSEDAQQSAETADETESDSWDNGVEGTGNVAELSSSLEALATARKASKTDA